MTDSTTQPATRVARVHADEWCLVMPPGWTSLSTEPEQAAVEIKRLIDRKMKGKARDEKIQARIEADRSMRQVVADARTQGATKVHLATEPIAGFPVSASLVVTPIRDSDLEDDSIGAALRDVDGVEEFGRVEIAGRSGVRRRRRTHGQVHESPDAPLMWRTTVDYVVDVADGERLLLVFSTTTEPLTDALVVLFDAMAESLRPDPRLGLTTPRDGIESRSR